MVGRDGSGIIGDIEKRLDIKPIVPKQPGIGANPDEPKIIFKDRLCNPPVEWPQIDIINNKVLVVNGRIGPTNPPYKEDQKGAEYTGSFSTALLHPKRNIFIKLKKTTKESLDIALFTGKPTRFIHSFFHFLVKKQYAGFFRFI
jgi:hypothetical protein